MSKQTKWKPNKDPLFRGDRKECVGKPHVHADKSLVRHILYLEGPGRETPYLSCTEVEDVAEIFAGQDGAVWVTMVKKATSLGIGHISKTELLTLLKGKGKGRAGWNSAFEVMQARRYVEQWSEHLLDFSDLSDSESLVEEVFHKR